MQAPIILLKEGTDTSQGKGQLFSNISACLAVADIARTTLGPRGMDKLLYEGRAVTITNDGATVMQLLNVVHPAAKILVDIAEAQDKEVGDGTTSVVLLAAELMREARSLIEDGLHPQVIMRGYKAAAHEAVCVLRQIQHSVRTKNRREMMIRCAETSLTSKLLAAHKELFAEMAVAAVESLQRASTDRHLVGIKRVTGGSVADSFLVTGVAFKKTFSYAGFEQQPKKMPNAKVLLLNLELELKAEKENAEVRITNPHDYQRLVDAEWDIIINKLECIANSGAQVVFSRLPIGDLATQFFADRDIFCAGRVEEGDMKRAAAATGAAVQSNVSGLTDAVLGVCGDFEELQIGSERFNLLRDCPKSTSATIILRGGASQFLEEAERSLHDALEVVRRVSVAEAFVPGGGAIEMELSKRVRDYSREIHGKMQVVVNSFARALEVVPQTLASNSGLDATEIMNKLRHRHSACHDKESELWGIDCINGKVVDTFKAAVWEPSLVKESQINAAAEAACLILSVDERVKNPKSNPEPDGPNAR